MFKIGQKDFYVNGEQKTSEAAPYIKDDRTLLPVRAIAESFDLTVEWDDATRTVNVK